MYPPHIKLSNALYYGFCLPQCTQSRFLDANFNLSYNEFWNWECIFYGKLITSLWKRLYISLVYRIVCQKMCMMPYLSLYEKLYMSIHYPSSSIWVALKMEPIAASLGEKKGRVPVHHRAYIDIYSSILLSLTLHETLKYADENLEWISMKQWCR